MSKKNPQSNWAVQVSLESFDSFKIINLYFSFQVLIFKINRSNFFSSISERNLLFCFSLSLAAGFFGMEEIMFCTWTVHVCCFWQHLLWLPWIRRALHISLGFCRRCGMVWWKGECLHKKHTISRVWWMYSLTGAWVSVRSGNGVFVKR